MRAILLGPRLGSKSQQKAILKSAQVNSQDFLMGVDGGTALWLEHGIQPHFAVGDWDSLKHKRAILSQVPHLTLSIDKDRSDLFFAGLAAIQAGATDLLCLGVTGGRPDHHLATLMDLSMFSTGRHGKLNSVIARGVEGDTLFLSTQIPFWQGSFPQGTTISIFALGLPAKGVTLKGFRYPLKNEDLHPSSFGLSNRVEKRKCEVHLRKGQLVVIMPSDVPKYHK